jgi:hypothetical protein
MSAVKTLGLTGRWGPAAALTAAGLAALTAAGLRLGHAALYAQSGGAFLLLAAWAGALGAAHPGQSGPIPVALAWTPRLGAQAAAQSMIFLYWGLYCPEVGAHVPTMLLQLAFTLALDMLVNWRRCGRLQFGASALPLVLSVNLFLWHDEAHHWQSLLVLAAGVLSKSLWRWKDERYGHVFNPSAIGLALAGLVYYGTHRFTFIRLDELMLVPPNTSEIVLAAGLVVQLGVATGPATLAGMLTMAALDVPSYTLLGLRGLPWPIEGQTFIGLTLLMTDPATSPRTNLGRAAFGALFGALFVVIQVSIFYGFGTNYVYFAKIFAAPLANLAVPWIDRRALAWTEGRPSWASDRARAARVWRLSSAAAIPLVFAVLWRPFFKGNSFEQSSRAEFKIRHAPPGIITGSGGGTRLKCEDNPVYCRPFSFAGELKLWAAARR